MHGGLAVSTVDQVDLGTADPELGLVGDLQADLLEADEVLSVGGRRGRQGDDGVHVVRLEGEGVIGGGPFSQL